MKEIDLTKCVNLRFRAKVDGTEGFGKIEKTSILLTGDDMFGCVVSPTEMDNLLRGVDLTTEDGNFYITDFEIVPRDPETYKDWQVGDTIEYSDNYSTGRIIFRNGDFVAADIEGTCNCYTCDELFNEGYRLVLTDIEQKIIEGKKKYEPQDGDIPKSYELRYGEPVLVRNGGCENWGIASYCRSEGTMHKVYVGSLTAFFETVIPYNERTMHLLGTSKDYKEED